MRFLVCADSVISPDVHPKARVILVEDDRVGGVFEDVPQALGDLPAHEYEGCVVTPGIIDSHNHFLSTGLQLAYGFKLEAHGKISFGELACMLREFAGKTDFPWVVGRGISAEDFVEGRLPTRHELDQAEVGKPIFLVHRSGHAAICDSKALRLAGVTRDTPDPPGGRIERDSSGEPTGVLHERSAMELVRSKIPPYTEEHYVEAVLRAQRAYIGVGLTCVKDTGGDGAPIDEEMRVRVLRMLEAEGKLEIRVGVAIPVFSEQELGQKIALAQSVGQSDRVFFAGFKLFLDGSGLTRTAWMKEDWNIDYDRVDRGNRGIVRWASLEEFERVFLRLCALDTNISVHAIGDAAIERVVTLAGRAREMGLPASVAIVHCYVPEDEHITKMAGLGISVETQPSFITFIGRPIEGNLGRERSVRLFPYRRMLEAGVTLCFGSDSPVTSFNPVYGFYGALTRRCADTPLTRTLGERLGFEQVVECYTKNPSIVLRRPELGGLSPGKKADFVVWDKEILRLGEKGFGELENIKPRAVYIGGKRLHPPV